MGVNKKIVNTRSEVVDGVKFDSQLEKRCYQILEEEGIPFDYNEHEFELVEGYRLDKVNLYQRRGRIRKDMYQYRTKAGKKLKMTSMTMTPDFIVKGKDPNTLIIIETKGMYNDVYPYKLKLFLAMLENDPTIDEVYFFEPRNIGQIRETVQIIEDLELC